MTLSWNDLLNEINEFFIKLTRNKIFKNEKDDFSSHVQSCLKLSKKEDWNYILASEDILEDSNLAIGEFLKFGMSGPTKYDKLGEKYLRLYGVLNAVYLQQQAILNLYKFFQCENVGKKRDEIAKLEITEVRHKLGSHSANFDDKTSDVMQVFVPVRFDMSDFKCNYFNHVDDSSHSVDLEVSIEQHLKEMCRTYIEIVKKTINTIYKCNVEKKADLLEIISPFESMIDGCFLQKINNTGEYVVIRPVSPGEI